MLTNPSIEAKTHALLESAMIRHGFFSRKGGVSTGLYHGLNVGSGSDDAPCGCSREPPPRRSLYEP